MKQASFKIILFLWVIGLVFPIIALLAWSLLKLENYQFSMTPSIDSYIEIYKSGRYSVIINTLKISLVVTVINIFLALPVALWLAKGMKSFGLRSLILALLTVPFFLSIASRIIVFRSVLGRTGPINSILMDAGLIDAPLDFLLFSEFSVYLGLLGPYFPTMVLPIYMSMVLIDDDLIEASKDLGAKPSRVFLDVILPLSAPGLVAGVIFTFVPMMGETVVAQLLGGANVQMLGSSISSLARVLNYPVAAALSVFVLVVLMVLLVAIKMVLPANFSLQNSFEGLRR